MRRNCNEIENGFASAGSSSGAKLAEGKWSSRGSEWLRDQMLLRKRKGKEGMVEENFTASFASFSVYLLPYSAVSVFLPT